MGLTTGAAGGKVALARWQLASLIGAAVAATGGSGVMVWRMAAAEPRQATANLSVDEARLLAKAEEARLKKQSEAKKLKQSDLGAGYQVDPEGNMTGPAENADLPSNKSLDEMGSGAGSAGVSAEIAKGIRVGKKGQGTPAQDEDVYGGAGFGRGGDSGGRKEDGDGEKVQRTELEKSMLGYSTVKTAKWATRRPDIAEKAEGGGGEGKQGSTGASEAIERVVGSAEKRLGALKDGVPMGNGVGMGGGVGIPGAGPSKGGSELMPAEEQGQSFTAGGVGDMRIGGEVGAEQLVRQGKFLDCVLVNEVRADLMDSPVIGMVSRDFVSLDGQYVLVPAGSKLIGSAGRVQNLQQARVYLRFDRVIFPDQRSAYFPVRRLPAVDGPGSVGIEGDVDRHFMLMFGSAVMLGMLDGLAAAVEGASNSATPTARELIVARTSMNMSQVVAGILARYGNVVPTITVEAGSKMKVFFAEDVRMTPYMRARDLAWVKYGR